jgi:hypothetical protein
VISRLLAGFSAGTRFLVVWKMPVRGQSHRSRWPPTLPKPGNGVVAGPATHNGILDTHRILTLGFPSCA